MLSSAVTGIGVESGVELLWWEWLTFYFDGAVHSVGGEDVLFPEAEIVFGVSPHGGIEKRLRITVISETERERSFLYSVDGGSRRMTLEARRFEFRVQADLGGRAALVEGSNRGNAAYLRRNGEQLLRAILEDPRCTLDLARKGIRNLRVVQDGLLEWEVRDTARVVVSGEVGAG